MKEEFKSVLEDNLDMSSFGFITYVKAGVFRDYKNLSPSQKHYFKKELAGWGVMYCERFMDYYWKMYASRSVLSKIVGVSHHYKSIEKKEWVDEFILSKSEEEILSFIINIYEWSRIGTRKRLVFYDYQDFDIQTGKMFLTKDLVKAPILDSVDRTSGSIYCLKKLIKKVMGKEMLLGDFVGVGLKKEFPYRLDEANTHDKFYHYSQELHQMMRYNNEAMSKATKAIIKSGLL
jgi:hypothetical protein